MKFTFLIIDTIRYLSLYDNKYLRYFKGHTKRYNLGEINSLNNKSIFFFFDI